MFRIFLIFTVFIQVYDAHLCGCKSMRKCYVDMLNILRDKDEEACIENVATGAGTVMIYLKALKQYCPEVVVVNEKHVTYEGRHLYEVIVNQHSSKNEDEDNKPVILIDAGQLAGADSTNMALVLIQQLAACEEYEDMIDKVQWVILPCVNPDGLEYSRYNRVQWRKNLKPSDDRMSYGVDLSRNFEHQWSTCKKCENSFSPHYPGVAPFSENETLFVKDVMNKYKTRTKAYISVRINGHSLLYPYAYSRVKIDNEDQYKKIAEDILNKVNQRAGVIQLFSSESIYSMNGKAHCGHSVDYAHDLGIPNAFEMRVFLGSETQVMTKFQPLPRGYHSSLLLGYLSGIKKLFEIVTADKKKNSLF